MSIKYIKGNLFDTQRVVIAHACNILGAFGSGVAYQIAKLYPEARKAYLDKFRTTGWKLGEIQVIEIPKYNIPINITHRVIVNMATQPTYGTTGRHVSYKACYDCFHELFNYCELEKLDVAIPKIGSGLAGGQWSKVEKELLKAIRGRNIEVDVYYL